MIKKLILFLLIPTLVFAATRNVQDNYQFTYCILDTSGNHVTGQTATLAIKKMSNGYWYDFSDSTFKNTGWTNKTVALTEDSTNGLYYYTFDPPASESSTEQYVLLVNNDDSTYGDHQTLQVSYQNIGTGTGTSTLSASDVWNNGTRTLTAGTNIALAKGTGITGFNDIAAADVWSVATRQLTGTQTFNLTGNITGNLSGSVGSLTTWDKTGYALSAAGIDAIWDEVQTGHTTALSFGKYLDAQVSTVGGGSLTEAGIADAVLDELTVGHTVLGSLSELLNGKKDSNGEYSDLEKLIRTQR